jgi:hypothetical protein
MSRGLWLTSEQIADIRREIASGKLHRVIAKRFAIDQSVVSRIARGRRKKQGVSCLCGECQVCRNRDASERYRARKREKRISYGY